MCDCSSGAFDVNLKNSHPFKDDIQYSGRNAHETHQASFIKKIIRFL